jgi:hypothetical protein
MRLIILRVSGTVMAMSPAPGAGSSAATAVRMAIASMAKMVNRCQGFQPRRWY